MFEKTVALYFKVQKYMARPLSILSVFNLKKRLTRFCRKCRESHLCAFVGQIRQGARIRGWGWWVNPILAMSGFWVHMDPQPTPQRGIMLITCTHSHKILILYQRGDDNLLYGDAQKLIQFCTNLSHLL